MFSPYEKEGGREREMSWRRADWELKIAHEERRERADLNHVKRKTETHLRDQTSVDTEVNKSA